MRASFTEVMNTIVAPLDQTWTRPKRKSKIKVPAGKSVCLGDLVEVNGGISTVSTSQEDVINENAFTSQENADNDTTNSAIFLENDSRSDDSTSEVVPNVELPVNHETLQKGCFALVKFLYNEGTKIEATKEFVAPNWKVYLRLKSFAAFMCFAVIQFSYQIVGNYLSPQIQN